MSESLLEGSSYASDAPPALTREGLPPSYRMRHDAHYVDKLTSRASAQPVRLVAVKDIEGAGPVEEASDLGPLTRSIRQHGVLQPLLVRIRRGRYELVAGAKRLMAAAAAGITEVPCLVHDADDVRVRNLAEATNLRTSSRLARAGANDGIASSAVRELEQNLKTMTSCLQMVSDPERSLRDRVIMELMRAEVRRMTRLVQGLNVLNAAPRLTYKTLDAGDLLRLSLSLLDPERRLLGVQVSFDVSESRSKLCADEQLLSVALAGAIGSVMAFLRDTDGGTLDISWSTSASRGRYVVSESAVTLPAASLSRIFDESWHDRPGGYPAAVDVIAARRVAELHGGSLDVEAGTGGGCQLTLELPLAR